MKETRKSCFQVVGGAVEFATLRQETDPMDDDSNPGAQRSLPLPGGPVSATSSARAGLQVVVREGRA